MKKVIIIGGGISGLSAAWFLQKKAQVTLFEKSSRFGGLICSLNHEGFLFECGPRGFLSKALATKQLVHELNLDSELVTSDKNAEKRYLFLNGKLQSFKRTFLNVKMIVRLICEWKNSSVSQHEESIGEFFARRLGSEFVSSHIDPLVKGIFAGNPYELSMTACFPTLLQWEKKYGSLTKAIIKNPKTPFSLLSFRDGMETLPKTIAQKVQADLHLETTVHKITLEKEKVSVETSKGSFYADHLIAAIPSKDLNPLIHSPLPQPYQLLTTVSLGFPKLVLKHKGFGYLVPSKEKEKILGMTWDSQIFPRHPSSTILCLMLDGHSRDALSQAKDILKRHLHINEEPQAIHINQAQIPQYPVGYLSSLSALSHPRLTLLGNSYNGPGLNDCIIAAYNTINLSYS